MTDNLNYTETAMFGMEVAIALKEKAVKDKVSPETMAVVDEVVAQIQAIAQALMEVGTLFDDYKVGK